MKQQSKAHQWDQLAKMYILARFDWEDIVTEDPDNVPPEIERNQAGAIRYIHARFMSEMGWSVARQGRQSALADWYAGLNSVVTPHFMNSDIIEILTEWGLITEGMSESRIDGLLSGWFRTLGAKTGQLFDGFRVPREDAPRPDNMPVSFPDTYRQPIPRVVFSVTYETVTPESAEQGEAESRGFEFEGREFEFAELVRYLTDNGFYHWSAYPLASEPCANEWLTSEPETLDFGTGETKRLSIHPENERAARYLRKAARAAGVPCN